MPHNQARRTFLKLSVVSSLGFWLLLFLAGFPLPTGDDLYFCGAAIHMVQGGTFSNPYCPGLAFLGARDHFFVYMPFQSYLLAGWLGLFGISRLALTGFQCLAGGCACIALLDFIGPVEGPRRRVFYIAGVLLSVALFSSASGLRPDLPGLCLFAIGLRLLKARTIFTTLLTSLFLYLSVITSPNIGILVPLVLLYAIIFSLAKNSSSSGSFYRRLGAMVFAGVLVAFAFLLMIGFQLESFLVIFNKSRENATFYAPLSFYLSDPWFRLRFFFNTVSLMLLAVALPITAAFLPAWFEKPIPRLRLVFFTLGALIVCFAESSSGSGIYLLVLFCLVLVLYFSHRLRPKYENRGMIFFSVLLLLTMVSQGRFLVQMALMPLAPRTSNIAEIRSRLEQLKPDYLFVDSAAAAELFDYKLPPNTFDCFFGVEGIWHQFPRAENLPRNSVVVVSTQTARGYNYLAMTRDPSGFHFVPIPFLHRLYSQLAADPYALFLIPVDAESRRK